MRLLHTSDWHLGKSLYEFSLLGDQEHFIRWLIGVIREERPDAVLLAGDVYDKPVPSADAIRLFDFFLSEVVTVLDVPVLTVAGNHDSGARLEFASGILKGSGCHIAGRARREIDRVRLTDAYGPVDIWLLPYLFPGDARALLPECRAHTFDAAYRAILDDNLPRMDKTARNVILAHGFFAGQGGEAVESLSEVNVGGMDRAGCDVFSDFDYTALGHLHAPQQIGGRVYYSGSPLKYSLSEENQRKSVTLAELGAPGEVSLTHIPIPALRDVRTVKGSFEQLMEPAFHHNRAFGDYVFAEITDTGAIYPMEKLRTLFPRLLGLRFPGREDSGLPVREIGAAREKLGALQLFCRFYSDVKGEDIPPQYLSVLKEAVDRMEKKEEPQG